MSVNASFRRQEYVRRKRTERYIRIGLLFFVFLSIIALISFVSHRTFLRITHVELSGGVLVTQADVEAETLSYISGSYLWLFPKNNALLYPRNGLQTDLRNHFKRIADIAIHFKNFRTLSVVVTERKPMALWCDTIPTFTSPFLHNLDPISTTTSSKTSEEKCYFLDDQGTVFAEAPLFSGDAYFKYFGDLATTTTSVTPIGGAYVASSSEFTSLSLFVSSARDLSLRPQYLVAEKDGQFTLVISGGGKIYFDMTEPIEKTIKNMNALLHNPPLIPSVAHDLPVDYIDLRYGNKLFYKLK